MNLDHDFFQVSKLSEDQKKRSSPNMEQVKTKKEGLYHKWNTFFPEFKFFSPNSSRDLCSDAHQSQIIRGDADEDHTQIIGGDISPLVLAPLSRTMCDRPAAE